MKSLAASYPLFLFLCLDVFSTSPFFSAHITFNYRLFCTAPPPPVALCSTFHVVASEYWTWDPAHC